MDASGKEGLSREKTRFVHGMKDKWRTGTLETEIGSQCAPCM